MSDGDPPSKRRAAENLIDETLKGVERAVDEQVTGIEIRRKGTKALVIVDGQRPAPSPRMGPLK